MNVRGRGVLYACVCLFQYMGGGPEPPLPLGAQEAPLVMNGRSHLSINCIWFIKIHEPLNSGYFFNIFVLMFQVLFHRLIVQNVYILEVRVTFCS